MRIVLLFLLFISGDFLSQNHDNLDHRLISSSSGTGVYVNGKEYHYSIGEPIAILGSNLQKKYTQGFLQPYNSITFDLANSPTSCAESSDGSLSFSNIEGCEGPHSISVDGIFYSNPFAQGLEAGLHEVLLFGQSCAVTLEVEILEGTGPCLINFFNGFTPNGDGQNESWIIENIELIEYQQNEIEIFNRYGVIVWQGMNYNNSSVVFKGQDLNGKDLPGGTYFYNALISNEEYKGFIEIVR